ncbi:MAG: YihY/virulence factor BrkB family protein [Candidatus Zixiibacteriota bacterium]
MKGKASEPTRFRELLKRLKLFGRWLWYYVHGLCIRLDEHHAFLMSGGLAFSLFVCTVPLLLAVSAVLSGFFDSPSVVREIHYLVERLVPYPEYAAAVKQFIGERLERMADVKQVVGVVGLVGLLFAASGLFSSLRTILKAVFRNVRGSSVVVGKLWDLALIVIILSFFVLLIVALPALEAATELSERVEWLGKLPESAASGIGMWLVSLVTLTVAFSAIYWLVPVRKPAVRTVLVAALCASLLWLLAKELFGYYITHLATMKQFYGVYTFLVVAAFWIYYSALVLIVGAEIGQLSSERKRAASK